MDRLQLALERAKAAAYEEGRADGARRRYRPGSIFPVLRDDYAKGYRETYTPAPRKKMGRPRKDAAA